MNTVLKMPEPVESPSTYEQVEAYWLLVSASCYCAVRYGKDAPRQMRIARTACLLAMPAFLAYVTTCDEERFNAIHERHVYIARLEARKP